MTIAQPWLTTNHTEPHTFHTHGRFVMAPMVACVTVELPIDMAAGDEVIISMQDIHGRSVAAHLKVTEMEPR